jgi:hypothetical protein
VSSRALPLLQASDGNHAGDDIIGRDYRQSHRGRRWRSRDLADGGQVVSLSMPLTSGGGGAAEEEGR